MSEQPLSWFIDTGKVALVAPSRAKQAIDDNSPANYVVYTALDGWVARIDGSPIHKGTLQDCLRACEAMDAAGRKEP